MMYEYFISEEPSEPEFELPAYSTPGDLLVEITNVDYNDHGCIKYMVEEIQYDSDTCVFWINEGVGVDYWLEDHVGDYIKEPGWYVIEGIVGHYIKGTYGFEEDSEEWEFKSVRDASVEEVEPFEHVRY